MFQNHQIERKIYQHKLPHPIVTGNSSLLPSGLFLFRGWDVETLKKETIREAEDPRLHT